MYEWIRDMTNIGSSLYHKLSKAIARGLQYQIFHYFNFGKYGSCREAVTKPLKISDLKMLSTIIVENMVICHKILNKASFSNYKPETRPRLPGVNR